MWFPPSKLLIGFCIEYIADLPFAMIAIIATIAMFNIAQPFEDVKSESRSAMKRCFSAHSMNLKIFFGRL